MKQNNFLSRCRKINLVIITASVVLIPLVYWHGVFFPYTFVKTVLFYALVELALFCWLALVLVWEEYRPRFSPILIAISGFLLVSSLAAFFGVDGSMSVWSGYERMFGLVTWFHIGAFILVLSSVVREKRAWDWLFGAVVGTATFVGLYAIGQGVMSADLSVSTIGNAAHLSSYLIPVFFLAAFLVFREGRFSAMAWLGGICAIIILSALPFTEARAGIVGLGAGIITSLALFLFLGEKQGTSFSLSHTTLKRAAAAVVILGILGVSLLLAAPEFSKMFLPKRLQGLLNFNVQERTASARLGVWQVAWEGWKERPLLGWGPENFTILFNEKYDPQLYRVEPWFDRAHSFIFDVGSTTGFAGLIAYLGMFGAALFMAMRQWNVGAMPLSAFVMVCAVFAAYLAQNLFTFDALPSFLLVGVVFAYVAAHDAHVPERQRRKTPGGEKNGRALFVMGVGALVLAGMGYGVALRPIMTNAAAYRGWELLRTGGGDDAAIAAFEKSIAYGTPYSIDARRFMAEYVFEFLKQRGKRPDESLRRLMEYAIQNMNENRKEEPQQVKWVMYRGELYSLMAQRFDAAFAKKAEEDFLRAKEMSPGRPQIYLELANARKLQGDINGAWQYIDYVITIVPDFVFGHLNAAVLAIETGDTEREERELVALRQHGELDNETLRDAYFKKGRYGDAARIQEFMLAFVERQVPVYTAKYRATLYAHLAALYQLAGETSKAREAALQVRQLDPARASEVQAFLQTLPE